VETTTRRRWKLSLVLVGLGVISAVLLVAVFATDLIGFGALRGEMDPAISAKIADLVRDWEGTVWPITVEGGGDRYTLRSGRVVLLLRHTQSGIRTDEIVELRAGIIERAKMELGKPEVFGVSEKLSSPGARDMVWGFAVPVSWEASVEYSVGVGFGADAQEISRIFAEALEWFEEQLVLQRDSGS